MRRLTARGMRLRKVLEQKFKVIEVYPGGAQDVWGIPRKHHSLEGLRQGLVRLGVKGIRPHVSGDELDAITCALLGKLYLEGKYTALGTPEEGQIIMPRLE
jgi:hypothetical protein